MRIKCALTESIGCSPRDSLRTVGPAVDTKFCAFFPSQPEWEVGTSPYWHEYFDLRVDPNELTNAFGSLTGERRVELGNELALLQKCSGGTCHHAGG